MFCKKCGKMIPDDSSFCQYCGEQLSEASPIKKQERKGLLSRFQSLSRGWQICLMSYILWALLWVILCSVEVIYESDQLPCLLIFVIVLPVVALFVWYYFARLRHKKKREPVSQANPINDNGQKVKEQAKSEYLILPLLQFAKEYGKMQVKTKKENDTITSSYCVFTNPNGEITKVDFSPTTYGMSADDISQKKERLFVVQNPDLEYKLIEI